MICPDCSEEIDFIGVSISNEKIDQYICKRCYLYIDIKTLDSDEITELGEI